MSSIRLLILGVMLHKQPIHGYEVRQELELWGADQWANIAYGSIYSALNKMAEEKLIEAASTDSPNKQAARTEYTMTERGKHEFERLLREYWWEWKPIIDPFQIALTFMDSLPHDELLAALRHRANLLRASIESFDYMITGKLSNPETPRHIEENLRLMQAHFETELRCVEQAISKVERHELP